MAFENITKGIWMIDEDRVKINKHGSTKYPLRVEDGFFNQINVVVSYETEPNRDNAEFVCFAFNLQQKYDIGLFEETVSQLQKILDYWDSGNSTREKTMWDRTRSILTQVKQNK